MTDRQDGPETGLTELGPVHVRRLLEINMAVLVVLGTAVLGLGRHGAVLPLCMLAAAAASLWLTDIGGRFYLGRGVINLAVAAAWAVSVWKYARDRGPVELLTVADLLVYLQLILLFAKKDFRTWWDLFMLSLAVVLLSAALRQGILFGAAAVLYLPAALSALALLHLYRQQVEQEASDHGAAEGSPGRALSGRSGVEARRLAKIALATVLVGPASLFLRYREPAREGCRRPPPDEPNSGSGRWPLAGRRSELAASAAGDCTYPPGAQWELWWRLAGVAAVTLPVAMVVFLMAPRFRRIEFSLPRFGRLAWGSSETSPGRTVGFSDNVTLGELGLIIENPEEVLKIQLTDYGTGETYPVVGEVYLRGAVLTHYGNGQWRHAASGSEPRLQTLEAANLPRGRPQVRQNILIKPMDRTELFCVWPPVVVGRDDRLRFDVRQERLHRQRAFQEDEFSYELGTTAFLDGVQTELVPSRKRVETQGLLQIPRETLPGLMNLAEQWIAESAIPGGEHVRRARFLEQKLRTSGRFGYSLEGQTRDAALDPVEDFITNNPRGHCEYFATALVLMLRSQGIPARMVVGYKSGEYDYLTRCFQVRQLHAHTWVEAYLDPGHVAGQLPYPDPSVDWSSGGWLRLDPTPGGSGLAAGANTLSGVRGWLEWLDFVWSSYVVGMDPSRQRDALYRPLGEMIRQTVRFAVSPGWWWRVLQYTARAFQAGASRITLHWPAGLTASGVLLLLVLLHRRSRRGLRRLLRRLAGRTDSTAQEARPEVGFYRRLEGLLARYGLKRRCSQTHREFARQAGSKIAEVTGEDRLADLPAEVVEAFYLVRFGGRALDDDRARTVRNALTQLSQASDGGQPTAAHASG